MKSAEVPVFPVPRVNNRLPTLACGLAWDASVLRADSRTGRRVGSDGVTGDPFCVVPGQRGAFVDLQLILVAVQDKSTVLAHVGSGVGDAWEGALAHTGDDKTGLTGGWSEVGTINFALLPKDVSAVALFIHCASGHLLSDAKNAKCAVFSMRDQQDIVGGPINSQTTTNLTVLFRRQGDDFVIQPINYGFNAGSLAEATAALSRF